MADFAGTYKLEGSVINADVNCELTHVCDLVFMHPKKVFSTPLLYPCLARMLSLLRVV